MNVSIYRGQVGQALRINDIAPDFSAETNQGPINFHNWIGDHYTLLFSHPRDFTPVCTTELGAAAALEQEFSQRNTKLIGLSVDSAQHHSGWLDDIAETQGHRVQFPIIADTDLAVAQLYNMLPASESDDSSQRSAADNATVRTVFLIGPDKKIKFMMTYPMTTGRNFAEILRVLDSIQLTAQHPVATPADWQQGGDCIIVPSLSDEDAKQRFPTGWQTLKPYLRLVKQPPQSKD